MSGVRLKNSLLNFMCWFLETTDMRRNVALPSCTENKLINFNVLGVPAVAIDTVSKERLSGEMWLVACTEDMSVNSNVLGSWRFRQ